MQRGGRGGPVASLGLGCSRRAARLHDSPGSRRAHAGVAWRIPARPGPRGVPFPDSGILLADETSSPSTRVAECHRRQLRLPNRLLAELFVVTLHELSGDGRRRFVYDALQPSPPGRGGWLACKGACPAAAEQPVIPGSMGATPSSWWGVATRRRWESASHGAGRARSRFSLARRRCDHRARPALGLKGVTASPARGAGGGGPAAYKPIRPVVDSAVEAGIVQRGGSGRPCCSPSRPEGPSAEDGAASFFLVRAPSPGWKCAQTRHGGNRRTTSGAPAERTSADESPTGGVPAGHPPLMVASVPTALWGLAYIGADGGTQRTWTSCTPTRLLALTMMPEQNRGLRAMASTESAGCLSAPSSCPMPWFAGAWRMRQLKSRGCHRRCHRVTGKHAMAPAAAWRRPSAFGPSGRPSLFRGEGGLQVGVTPRRPVFFPARRRHRPPLLHPGQRGQPYPCRQRACVPGAARRSPGGGRSSRVEARIQPQQRAVSTPPTPSAASSWGPRPGPLRLAPLQRASSLPGAGRAGRSPPSSGRAPPPAPCAAGPGADSPPAAAGSPRC